MKNYFLYSFFIIFLINFDTALGMEQQCVATTCNRYTQGQVIRHLWNQVKNPTPLGKQLAQLLSSMSRSIKEPSHKLNTIFGQTLWSMGVYSGFDPDNLAVSCVFERILYLTILDDEFDVKEYNQAIANYSALIREARIFATRLSLSRYSCPTSNPHVTLPRPQECLNGSIVNIFLEKYGSTLPSEIVSLIASLNKSTNDKDRAVAVIMSAVSTEPLNGLYQCVLETPELLKAAQLIACDVPILPCCCKIREEDFQRRFTTLEPVARKLLDAAMKK